MQKYGQTDVISGGTVTEVYFTINECTQKCKSFKSQDVKNAEENQKTSKSSMTEKRGLQKGLQVEKVS